MSAPAPHRLDLDAYCARIGYAGPRQPTLATLRGLQLAHVQAIPFENLDVLLGRGIDLALPAIERKLVHARRGGYCFEQNALLLAVLLQLGFAATPLSARVRIGRARDVTPPRTHLCIRVDLDGEPWLCDVGVGGLSPTAPLRLDTEAPQPTPHETRRLVRAGDWHGERRDPTARIFHQVLLAGEWQDVYEFTLEPMAEIDREVANWFTAAHPQSHFRNRLMAARATADGRLTVLNREFSRRGVDGKAEVRALRDQDELLAVLAEHFALHLPVGTRFDGPAFTWATA